MMASALYERAMLNQAACIRALCQSEAESIRNYGCQNPICIIPNGMDLPRGPFADPAWQTHVEPGAKVLFYLGRLHPKKGLRNLLQAWAEVQGARAARRKVDGGWKGAKEWVLVIAGWGEGGHEVELKRLAGQLGIQWADVREMKDGSDGSGSGDRKPAVIGPGGLIFLGPQFGGAKANCYHHSDAFILPSLSEGLPMVILEAWSHGKLAVMTPGCNLPEGFAANAGIQIGSDFAEIVPGLQRLFAMSQAERDEMGKRGLHLISEKFNWERISAELLAVSDWVLHGGVTPESVCRGQPAGVFPGGVGSDRLAGRTGSSIEREPAARFHPHEET
jgi:poly(glycerol-phosphate) alpha-glucosyltransferase